MYPGFISYGSNRRENVNHNKRKTLHLKKLGTFDLKNLTLKQIFATFEILNLTFNRTYSFKYKNIMFKTKIQRIKK